MLTPAFPIVTDRLALRPFKEDDLEFLADVWSRPEVVQHLYEDVQTRGQVAATLAKRTGMDTIRAEGDRLALIVERSDTGDAVGDMTLAWTSEAHGQGEIGFVFHPDHHGHGYAVEASRPLFDLGFRSLGLHRIVGRSDGRNSASQKVMEKLGMRREAHLVENEFVKGEWTDEVIWAILATEWSP